MADKMAERDTATMFYVGNVPFLPHYLTENVYVAPGGGEWKEDELTAMGGKMVPTFLWPRQWQQQQAKAAGIKPRALVRDNKAPKVAEKSSPELLHEMMKSDGTPMSAVEMARELRWTVSRVRDSINILKERELLAPWGTRQNANAPQLWVAK